MITLNIFKEEMIAGIVRISFEWIMKFTYPIPFLTPLLPANSLQASWSKSFQWLALKLILYVYKGGKKIHLETNYQEFIAFCETIFRILLNVILIFQLNFIHTHIHELK